MKDVYNFQGITEDKDKDFFSLHIFIRAFLLLSSILSGVLCGLTAVMGKIFIITLSNSTGILDVVTNVSAWITGISVVVTVFSNLINVNITVSLYSQLITMPTYECAIIFGNLISGGLIMNEFAQYSYTNLGFIAVGSSLCMLGIMYKVCMLENADKNIDD